MSEWEEWFMVGNIICRWCRCSC